MRAQAIGAEYFVVGRAEDCIGAAFVVKATSPFLFDVIEFCRP